MYIFATKVKFNHSNFIMQLHPIWKIVFMLVFTYVLLAFYSFSKRPIKIGKIELVKSEFKDYFTKPQLATASTIQLPSIIEARDTAKPLVVKDSIIPEKHRFPSFSIHPVIAQSTGLSGVREPMDTTKQRILLIGDSMLEGLMLRLKDYTEENHHDMKAVIWYGSSTKIFGTHDTLAYFVRKFQPTYVWICLGGNELFVRGIKKDRDPYVKNILKQIGNCKYIWIGPPNWKEDTGINLSLIHI